MKFKSLISTLTITIAILCLFIADASAATRASKSAIHSKPRVIRAMQDGCPIIFPDRPVAVAPNQPAVPNQSTIGIINALCDVTLDFVGCGFTPSSITLGCDTNGDGTADLGIPLKNITPINNLLFQATIPSLAATPGTAFPLVCCGGKTSITLTLSVTGGDDNIFGPFIETTVCDIDLGIRAPVVVSATPAVGDCVAGINQIIPGSCFLLAGGKPNVTSVFGVEKGNPNNVIQANTFQILTTNLIGAFFQPGPTQAGKTFLIFVSGPNGTSRNLSTLPSGAPSGCPLGNEQGVQVAFQCKSSGSGGSPGDGATPPTQAVVSSCRIDREETGALVLSIFGHGIRDGSTLTISGVTPKKVKFRDADPVDGSFTRILVRKKFCESLPGAIVITNPDGSLSQAALCNETCVGK